MPTPCCLEAACSGMRAFCLEEGAWKPVQPGPQPTWPSTMANSTLARALRPQPDKISGCGASRSSLRHEWRPRQPGCSEGLQRGLMATHPSTSVVVIGDSLGGQVTRALQHAVANARGQSLRGLRVEWGVKGFGVVPRTLEGALRAIEPALEILELISAGQDQGVARRALLVNVGAWYVMSPWCSAARAHKSPACAQLRAGRVVPNDTHPESTRPFETGQCCGWYSLARRVEGSATLREYASDVSTLLAALEVVRDRWRARFPLERPLELLWYETLPQHWCAADPAPLLDGRSCLHAHRAVAPRRAGHRWARTTKTPLTIGATCLPMPTTRLPRIMGRACTSCPMASSSVSNRPPALACAEAVAVSRRRARRRRVRSASRRGCCSASRTRWLGRCWPAIASVSCRYGGRSARAARCMRRHPRRWTAPTGASTAR